MPTEEADWILNETLREALAESNGVANPIDDPPEQNRV